MKINEIFEKPGFLRGVVSAIAPNAVATTQALSGIKNRTSTDLRQHPEYQQAQLARKLESDPKVKVALDKAMAEVLKDIQKQQASDETIPQPKSSFSKWSKKQVSEATTTPTYSLEKIQKIVEKHGVPPEGIEYIASKLATSGVRVLGYQPAAGSDAARVSKEIRGLDVLVQRATRTGKSSMAEISKIVPTTGVYADKTKRDERIKELAKHLTDKGVRVQGYQAQVEPDKWDWDSSKSVLTVTGPEGTFKYRKLRDGGWADEHTNEIIPPENARELQVQFDKLTGRVAYPGGRPAKRLTVNQVTVKSGEVITKAADGHWYRESGDVVTDPKELSWLERTYLRNKQTAAMANQPVQNVQPAAAKTITNPSVAV